MFIEALFIIVKIWKQPKGPSTDERMKKMLHTHTHTHTHTLSLSLSHKMECYSGIEKMKFGHLQQNGWTWNAYAK